MNNLFRRFAAKISKWAGSSWAFIISLLSIVVWLSFGPHYHFSDSFQLPANTVTTLVNFAMVFVIQNTQNREMTALHLKIDELIRIQKKARNNLIRLENKSDEEISKLEEEFDQLKE